MPKLSIEAKLTKELNELSRIRGLQLQISGSNLSSDLIAENGWAFVTLAKTPNGTMQLKCTGISTPPRK